MEGAMTRMVPCFVCGGEGWVRPWYSQLLEKRECTVCNGTGEVEEVTYPES